MIIVFGVIALSSTGFLGATYEGGGDIKDITDFGADGTDMNDDLAAFKSILNANPNGNIDI